ncbi:MAG: adenylyl-sulfate kinase [Chloroflexi bacterium]|nr:adenylyl-sulfate kinase [Chloroflexota bacterium]
MGNTENLSARQGWVHYADRCRKYGQPGLVVWFTGLSGSGKTTLALEVEKRLFEQGRLVYRLDGDGLRQGLNAGLDFTPAGRRENIRRAAEVARLFQDAGLIVLASFISPQRDMRTHARSLVPVGAFIEVYVRASLEACIARDPKGFYRRALQGEIKDYTGIAQEYEEPLSPELIVDTEANDLEECVRQVLAHITAALAAQSEI